MIPPLLSRRPRWTLRTPLLLSMLAIFLAAGLLLERLALLAPG